MIWEKQEVEEVQEAKEYRMGGFCLPAASASMFLSFSGKRSVPAAGDRWTDGFCLPAGSASMIFGFFTFLIWAVSSLLFQFGKIGLARRAREPGLVWLCI